MLKASAGGGGKGMRMVRDDDAAREGFASASSEARSSFGDDRMLIEKFIAEPRHIEIQVLADAHGNTVHLGERECSIQRRHQKIIEEAPSPFIDAATRAAMGAQAVALAAAVDYRSAGTVEFIVDANKNFYFLEMNTRLQVEHPVTELTTGIDLVEQMIRVAAGETLGFGQDDIGFDGWAIEGRVYAEDPARGFLPSPGRLTRYRPPTGADGVRLDSGVYEGAEVTMFYDPMIAKLCAWGDSRAAAIERMRAAIDGFEIVGPGHNLDLLAAVMRHPRFVEGAIDTGFIDDLYADGFSGAPIEGAARDALVVTALAVHLASTARANRISGRVASHCWQPDADWVVGLDGETSSVTVVARGDGLDVDIDGRRVELDGVWRVGASTFEGRVDGLDVIVQVTPNADGYRLRHAGCSALATVRRARVAELAALMPLKEVADSSRFLLSPMPGRVVSIAVVEGDDVKVGQPLAVIDAMKMENVLRAHRDGCIAKVVVGVGDSLSTDQVILEFE